MKKIHDDPGPSKDLAYLWNSYVDRGALNLDIIVKKVIIEKTDTALILKEKLMNDLTAYPCQVIDLKDDAFKQYYALGLQKDAEIAPILNFWLLKAQQSGELNFWKSKVSQTPLHI